MVHETHSILNSRVVENQAWHGNGRRTKSSFTLQVSVKSILAYNKSHARENAFYLKQVCAKLRLTQLELHGRRHTFCLKLHLELQRTWDTFNSKRQSSTKSYLTEIKWYGRRKTSKFAKHRSAKLISAHHKWHATKNAFILKLQMFAKLKLTQLEWYGRENTFFFKRIGIADAMHRVLNGIAAQSLV